MSYIFANKVNQISVSNPTMLNQAGTTFFWLHMRVYWSHNISQIEQIQVTKNWNNFISKRIQNDIKPWHMVFGVQLKLPGNNSILPATGKSSRSLHFDH